MRHDAIVVGGSFAGLSAALYLARARRSVCVIDAGLPRNRFAPHSHGLFAHDGIAPGQILEQARAQVAAYPSVTMLKGRARAASGQAGRFCVELESGAIIEAARLVLAFGISDELPPIPGLQSRWGRSVLHCPYCHGFEFSGQRLGVLNTSPMSIHQVQLIAEWGPTTFFLNGADMPDATAMESLVARGISVEPEPVVALQGGESELRSLALASGRGVDIDALYLMPRTHLNSALAAQLGCEMEDGVFGAVVKTDDTRHTTVPGVYAVGDIARSMHSATWASADGVTAGTSIHRNFVFPENAP